MFHNTIDVWIASCLERGSDWNDPDGYRRFVRHLRDGGMDLRDYRLCVGDAESPDARERRKAEFADSFAKDDPDGATYSIRMSDSVISRIRGFPGTGTATASASD